MARAIALARNIKLEWLNKTVGFLTQTTDREQAKAMLNEYLGQSIKSPTVLRKTRELLLHTWCDAELIVRDHAIRLYHERNTSHALPLHWAMLMMQFPIFCDLTGTIGKAFMYKDEISVAHIKQRIFEIWGERNTLEHSLSKNIQMLKSFGVIIPSLKHGGYQKATIEVSDGQIVAFLLYAILTASSRTYMTWDEFVNSPMLFPFFITGVSQSDIMGSDMLTFERSNGEVVICVRH